jgi:hypothetical protein
MIKLRIGPMSLEGDETSKGDTVLAHLYNGYRASTTDASMSIHSVPGYVEFCDLGTGNSTVDGDWYSILHSTRLTVSAGRIFSVSNNGIATELTGAILAVGVPASFTEDENHIFFCARSVINRLDPLTGVVDQLGVQAPVNCTHLGYLKGYMVATGERADAIAGDTFYSSSVTDSEGDPRYQTWDVFNNMARPDGVSAIFTTFREIYAIGRETTEISYTTTDPAAPFASNEGATQPFGTQAPYSVAFDQQSLYYLTTIGGNRVVCRLTGGREAQQLSFAVGVPINDPSAITDARGWIQSWNGQTFYVLQMPSTRIVIDDQVHNGVTLVFSVKAQEWYIWYEWDAVNGECKRYPADTFLFVEPIGKRFVGYQGKLWELRDDAFFLGSTPVRMRIRMGNRSWGKLSEKACNRYSYSLRKGSAAGVVEPIMIHRWRNDGNAEWEIGRTVSLGVLGSRDIRQKSLQCGKYVTRQDELIFPDPVSIVFNEIEEEVEGLK